MKGSRGPAVLVRAVLFGDQGVLCHGALPCSFRLYPSVTTVSCVSQRAEVGGTHTRIRRASTRAHTQGDGCAHDGNRQDGRGRMCLCVRECVVGPCQTRAHAGQMFGRWCQPPRLCALLYVVATAKRTFPSQVHGPHHPSHHPSHHRVPFFVERGAGRKNKGWCLLGRPIAAYVSAWRAARPCPVLCTLTAEWVPMGVSPTTSRMAARPCSRNDTGGVSNFARRNSRSFSSCISMAALSVYSDSEPPSRACRPVRMHISIQYLHAPSTRTKTTPVRTHSVGANKRACAEFLSPSDHTAALRRTGV